MIASCLDALGTLSEAELFPLRTRLHEGRWNKARKGLLQFPLPVGYIRGSDGAWELDPDQQVRERLAYLFETFRCLGVARQVVRELKHQGLDLPTRIVSKDSYGLLIWKRPTLSAVVRILENPAYAGASVYGRWEYEEMRAHSQPASIPCWRRNAQKPDSLTQESGDTTGLPPVARASCSSV